MKVYTHRGSFFGNGTYSKIHPNKISEGKQQCGIHSSQSNKGDVGEPRTPTTLNIPTTTFVPG